MQAMEARMPVTRPNKLLSLWPAYITGSDQTFFGKPNPFNQFPSYYAFCLKCFVVMGSSARLDFGDLKVVSAVSIDVFKDTVICSAFQMRPSVITCVSSLSRNHSCRSELHRGHSSGQSGTLVKELHHQMVTPLPSIHSLSLTHWGVWFWCHPCLLLQQFLNVTMTTWLRSTSREASEWTTRKPAPSSSLSASLSMTTSQRPWETSGCRLNPSPPPVLPHLPAAQVLLTPPPTAKAQISLTKSPPADCQRLPAIGLSIKAGRNLIWEDSGVCDFKHFTACRSACWAMEKKASASVERVS